MLTHFVAFGSKNTYYNNPLKNYHDYLMKYIGIIGRPNVGKSTLFNRILGQRAAIVDNTPGVTRDRNFAIAYWGNKVFTIIDTGGFEPKPKTGLSKQMREQAQMAIEESDFIFFVVDGQTGPTPIDQEIADKLRKSERKIYLVVNKIDHSNDHSAIEFTKFGFGQCYPISAEHNLGIGELLEDALNQVTAIEENEAMLESVATRIAVVGKPNVGKSSLVNRFAASDRMMVSEMAGTTRDAIDTDIKINGVKYQLIDTAGIRRKAKVSAKLEKFSIIMAIKAINRADIVILMLDATEGLSTQDAKIGSLIEDSGKGCIILFNKWDLIDKTDKTALEFEHRIRNQMKFLAWAPMIFISAATGQRVSNVWKVVEKVKEQMGKRISSSKLNIIFGKIEQHKSLPFYKSKQVKIYYVTQANVNPPTFIFMTNYPDALKVSYKRFIANQLRQKCELNLSPLRLIFRKPSGRRTRAVDIS